MRALVNPALDPASVTAVSLEASAFHAAMDGYRPTPMRELGAVAAELGLNLVALKDESSRFGLPAFKVLGASWAVERALSERPGVRTLVAASAGNHGRAVAHVAARRDLACRIFLPFNSAPARRAAIEEEGAEVIVVDGGYEDAVGQAAAEGTQPGCILVADVGASGPASWVIDGYATLFAEAAVQGTFDVVLVPAGVGSLAAAAARFGAQAGARVIAVEPETAACLTASLAAGAPARIENTPTTMAGLDCAEVSEAAWPDLRAGLAGTIAVSDAEAHAAMRELAAAGLTIGDCGAAPLAALRALVSEPACASLRDVAGLGADCQVLLVGTEGATDPDGYRRVVAP